MAVTWGLGVSMNKAKTAAVAIDWSTERTATVIDVVYPLMASDVPPSSPSIKGADGLSTYPSAGQIASSP